MNLETRINNYYYNLNENDRDVISYILKNKRSVENMTITSLATVTLTSKSSILRLTKKLGYSGYSEFKFGLRNDRKSDTETDTVLEFIKLQDSEIENTKKLFMQTEIEPILDRIHQSRRMFFFGTGGGQRDVLSNLSRSLISLNKFPILIPSLKELEMVSQDIISEKDLLVVVSLSGDIKQAYDVMLLLKMKNISILSITDLRNNGLASLATYNLYFQSASIEYNNQEFTSFLPLYIITDLLYRKYTEYVINLEHN